jgi:hypothetical protein
MNTFNSEIIAYMLTVIIEGCLTLFSYKFHKQNKGYILMWIAYLAVSIIASQGAIIGDTVEKITNKVHTSQEYKKYESEITNIDSQISTYQEKLKSLKAPEIKNSSVIDSLNAQLTERRAELASIRQTPKTEAERQRKISQIEGLKGQIESERQLIDATKNTNTQSIEIEKGYKNAIEKLNADKKTLRENLDKDLQKFGAGESAFRNSLNGMGLTEIRFWTAFFILLEITRFLLLNDANKLSGLFSSPTNNDPNKKRLYDKLRDWSNSPTKGANKKDSSETVTALSNNPIIAFNPTPTPKNPTKFKIKKKPAKKSAPVITLVPKLSLSPTQNLGFTNKDLDIYINHIFENTTTTKNGLESPGITSISKSDIGLSYKTCRAIHGYLSTLGAIQTKGRTTIILKSKSELLCTVKKAI